MCTFIYWYPLSSKEDMRKEGEHVKIPEFIDRKVLFPRLDPEKTPGARDESHFESRLRWMGPDI